MSFTWSVVRERLKRGQEKEEGRRRQGKVGRKQLKKKEVLHKCHTESRVKFFFGGEGNSQ